MESVIGKTRSVCFTQLQWQECDWNGTYLISKSWMMGGCRKTGFRNSSSTHSSPADTDFEQVFSFTCASVLFLHNRNVQLPQNDWNFHVSIALPCNYDNCSSQPWESLGANAFRFYVKLPILNKLLHYGSNLEILSKTTSILARVRVLLTWDGEMQTKYIEKRLASLWITM